MEASPTYQEITERLKRNKRINIEATTSGFGENLTDSQPMGQGKIASKFVSLTTDAWSFKPGDSVWVKEWNFNP